MSRKKVIIGAGRRSSIFSLVRPVIRLVELVMTAAQNRTVQEGGMGRIIKSTH